MKQKAELAIRQHLISTNKIGVEVSIKGKNGIVNYGIEIPSLKQTVTAGASYGTPGAGVGLYIQNDSLKVDDAFPGTVLGQYGIGGGSANLKQGKYGFSVNTPGVNVGYSLTQSDIEDD